ncbi:MAG: GxxExxY protein [Novipirellula sp. JB048]
MRAIDYKVMAQVFATHRELGPLADESVYQQKLLQLLKSAGMEAVTEIPVSLRFRHFCHKMAIDLVVDRKVVYELKTVAALTAAHESQLLGYLFMLNGARGKLINVRNRSLQSRFVNAPLTKDQRRQFVFDVDQYAGDGTLSRLTQELLGDWGTGLHPAIYRRAISYCFSNGMATDQLLPMRSCGEWIGNQRFHLLSDSVALGVTAYKEVTDQGVREFQKLVSASPLCVMHWLNVTHHRVMLRSIRK